jgi:maltooligosyltrehalose trehalohydrolase
VSPSIGGPADALHRLGATPLGQARCGFRVWAPWSERVSVQLFGAAGAAERSIPLERDPRGYHGAVVDGVEPGVRYRFELEERGSLPDPASRFQPEGVHGPSEVIDLAAFPWTDHDWRGLPLDHHVVYELHVGTFSPEGTFEGIVEHLDDLAELGVTAIELMPVAQFPGTRNWGYDGVFPFAAQSSYGGPWRLQALVDQCHRRGLAVVLDVVYNHLGPEGNWLRQYGPYFTDRYRTPWGDAVNFDGPGSDEVRSYFIASALQWLEEFHVDALRIDAIHGIVDVSARPFLQELADAVHERAEQRGQAWHLIAESDLGDPRVVRPPELGGLGLDAQWSDDFHHAVHTLVTGEAAGYYRDFGRVQQLAKLYREGYVYTGQYSEFRGRRFGASPRDVPARRFVVSIQNHDQVGNRMLGERLSALAKFEQLKLAAGAMILSPFIPLLFMGEEYAEPAPFLYFTSHSDPDLVEAVRQGRAREFESFAWHGEPPDPQDGETFERSRLDRAQGDREPNATLRRFYRELLALRRSMPSLGNLSKDDLEATADDRTRTVTLHRWHGTDEALAAFHFGDGDVRVPLPSGEPWTRLLDSAGVGWGGPGTAAPDVVDHSIDPDVTARPWSVMLFNRSAQRVEG